MVVNQVPITMTSPGDKLNPLNNYLNVDVSETVGYESDTDLKGEVKSKPITPMCDDESRRAPSSFLERGAVNALEV